MAGANNAFMKSVGFRARETAKIRATYGTILSPKDAKRAAEQAGVRIPPKLTARLDAMAAKAALKTKAAAALAERIQRDAKSKLEVGAPLGRREGNLAKKLTDRQVQIMSIAQREIASYHSTGQWDHKALTPREWAQAERLLERV